MLEARGLSKSYGSVPAVRNISFCLMPGQVLDTWAQTAREKVRR